jgi:hypothetical protein
MKKVYLSILVIGLLASCSPIYYMPNNANIPLHKEKNEIQASGYLGDASGFRMSALSASYTITDNIGLMLNAANFSGANGTNYSFQSTPPTEDVNYNAKNFSNMGELGVGFFKPLKADSSFIFETYIGYGLYSFNRALNESQSVAYRIHRPFIQPSIGYRGKRFEAAYGLRIVQLAFSNKKPSAEFLNDNFTKFQFDEWDNTTLLEHSITLRVGSEKVKFQMQWVYTPSILFQNQVMFGTEDLTNISMGVLFRLN